MFNYDKLYYIDVGSMKLSSALRAEPATVPLSNHSFQKFFFSYLHFYSYVFQFVQDLLSRNIDHKSAKNEQFANDFLDFGMSEV